MRLDKEFTRELARARDTNAEAAVAAAAALIQAGLCRLSSSGALGQQQPCFSRSINLHEETNGCAALT